MKTQFIGAMVGLSLSESIHLFDSDWQPRGCNEDTSHEVKAKLVAEALRAIADGEKVLNV